MTRTTETLELTPAEQESLHRRTLRVVIASQVFGGAGLAAGVTVGALLAQDLLGGESGAGIPAALLTLGSALSAFVVGRVSQRRGRRFGLAGGFLVGALGAAGIVLAATTRSVALLLPALFVYGSGSATNLQARYAGTDLASPLGRARAASFAMVASTFGAVAGPNSVERLGTFAASIGLPTLAGPFLLAALAYGLAGTVMAVFLRPDPLLLARRIAHRDAQASVAVADVPVDRPRGVALGASIMVLVQIAMVAIMTMTPVHMRSHGHDLGEVGFVIGMHIAAMFLPSLVTGQLVDRIGRVPMAIAAAVTLLTAGATAGLAPGDSMTWLTVALVLLGLGWNFGFISGTALIVDSTSPDSRAKTQGTIDVLVAIAGAGGGVLSGLIVGLTSYATLALGGGVLALLLIPMLVWHRKPAGTLA